MLLRARVLGLATLVAFAFLVSAGAARAAVYWGVFDTQLHSQTAAVGAVGLDGAAPSWDYLKDLEAPGSGGTSCGVAVTATHLYWAGDRGIGRVNLDGSALPQTIVSTLPFHPCGITADQSHVYWADRNSGTIGRAAVDGSAVYPAFLTGLQGPCDVTIADGYLYWAEATSIGRVRLDGTGLERGFLPGDPSGGCGIAVRGDYAYWGAFGAIARANLDGSELDSTFIDGVGGVEGIAVDASHVYWADHPSGGPASIGRAKLDGSNANRTWVPADPTRFFTSSQSTALGVAVDSRPAPPPLMLPVRPVQFGKLKHDAKKGTAVLDVWVPDWGALQMTCPGLRCRVIADSVPHPARAGALRWRAFLKPLKGKAGRRIRTQLNRKGLAAATVEATFTYKRTEPTSAVRQLKLRKRLKPAKPR